MPQPLSAVKRNSTFSVTGREFQEHPAFAIQIAQAISIYAVAEANYALILAAILKANAKTATAMYLSLTGADARKAALFTAAKERLDADTYKLFERVFVATKAGRDRRNDFAHHIWATPEGIPNALALVKPENLGNTLATLLGAFHSKDVSSPISAPDLSEVMVYRQPDFRESIELCARAANVTRMFFGLIALDGLQTDAMRHAQLDQLLGLLDSLKMTSESDPEGSQPQQQ